MLKTRIIPCLDVKDGRVVKGINFVDLVDAGDPVEQAKLYDQQGADELCFLDIGATHENRDVMYDVVTQVAEHCFMPLTVGGGVRTMEDVRNLLLAGADKVSINSAAVKRPEFVREAAEKFGSQCIVVAIDAKAGQGAGRRKQGEGNEDSMSELALSASGVSQPNAEASKPEQGQYNNNFQIFTHGGRKETGIDAIEWAERMVEYGAGEILLTSMDRDGTKAGFDIPLTRAIADRVSVPVIASGGVGELKHFVGGVREGHASALLAASVFHFGTFSIEQVKQYMQKEEIPVRL